MEDGKTSLRTNDDVGEDEERVAVVVVEQRAAAVSGGGHSHYILLPLLLLLLRRMQSTPVASSSYTYENEPSVCPMNSLCVILCNSVDCLETAFGFDPTYFFLMHVSIFLKMVVITLLGSLSNVDSFIPKIW